MTKIEIFILTIRFCYIFLEKNSLKIGINVDTSRFK